MYELVLGIWQNSQTRNVAIECVPREGGRKIETEWASGLFKSTIRLCISTRIIV